MLKKVTGVVASIHPSIPFLYVSLGESGVIGLFTSVSTPRIKPGDAVTLEIDGTKTTKVEKVEPTTK